MKQFILNQAVAAAMAAYPNYRIAIMMAAAALSVLIDDRPGASSAPSSSTPLPTIQDPSAIDKPFGGIFDRS